MRKVRQLGAARRGAPRGRVLNVRYSIHNNNVPRVHIGVHVNRVTLRGNPYVICTNLDSRDYWTASRYGYFKQIIYYNHVNYKTTLNPPVSLSPSFPLCVCTHIPRAL